LPWASSVQLRLNVRLRKLQSRRTTVDNHTNAPAVRFTPRRNSKQMAK
jgi:hypothetical protein